MSTHHAVSGPQADLIRLRRDGTRPLRFTGWIIARHDGQVPDGGIWHRLGLYRDAAGGFIVEIVACQDDGNGCRTLRCMAAPFVTLEEALSQLEQHDPTGDIWPSAADGSPATAMRQFMDMAILHGVCHDVARRYRIGVGTMLAGLGMQPL